MRFVSIDVETTGLNPEKHQLLEIGAVVVDTEGDEHPLSWPSFRFLITHPNLGMDNLACGPYCADLHSKTGLWQALQAIKDPYSSATKLLGTKSQIGHCPEQLLGVTFAAWLKQFNFDRVIAAGKNFATFDKVFLEKCTNFKQCVRFAHRMFDPATYFIKRNDVMIPNLDECCQRAGLDKNTDHTALADARIVGQLCLIGLHWMEKACTI